MLIISRKPGQSVRIGEVTVTVLSGNARLGITAPATTPIVRSDAKKKTKAA